MDDKVRHNDHFRMPDGKTGHVWERGAQLFLDSETNMRPRYGVGAWKDVELLARNVTFEEFKAMQKESNGI